MTILSHAMDMLAAGGVVALVAAVGGAAQGACGAHWGREADTASQTQEAQEATRRMVAVNTVIGLAQAAASVLIWQAMT